MISSKTIVHGLSTNQERRPARCQFRPVTATDLSQVIFIEQVVKINHQIYRKTIPNDYLLSWACKQFGRNHWTFEHDAVPSHKAREMILEEKVSSSFLNNNGPRIPPSQTQCISSYDEFRKPKYLHQK